MRDGRRWWITGIFAFDDDERRRRRLLRKLENLKRGRGPYFVRSAEGTRHKPWRP